MLLASILLHIFMHTTTSTGPLLMCGLARLWKEIFRADRQRLVLAWAELHKDELMANWRLVMNGEEPFKISPLL